MKTLKFNKLFTTMLAIALTVCLAFPVITCTANADAVSDSYSYYAATGDSITEGLGLSDFDGTQTIDNSSPKCYAQLVKAYIGNNCTLKNLSKRGTTPGEYLDFLTSDGTPSQAFIEEAAIQGKDIDQYKVDYRTKYDKHMVALKSADLITINFGQVNVMDDVLWKHFGKKGLCGFLGIPESEAGKVKAHIIDAADISEQGLEDSLFAIEKLIEGVDFGQGDEEKNAVAKEKCTIKFNALLKTVSEFKDNAISNPSKYLKNGIYAAIKDDLIANADTASDGTHYITDDDISKLEQCFEKDNLKAAYDTAYAHYTAQVGKCIDKIIEINSNKAQIVLMNYYNPATKLSFGGVINLALILRVLGSPFYNAADLSFEYTAKMNSHISELAADYGVPCVDISGIPMSDYTHTFHPDSDAHAYIAEQVEDTLFNNIKIDCGEGGTATVIGDSTVKYGDSRTIKITEESGCTLKSILVNRKSVSLSEVSNGLLTIENITDDIDVEIEFNVPSEDDPSVDPDPVDPDPTPVDPTPVDPDPVDPDPTPVDPTPVDPAPVPEAKALTDSMVSDIPSQTYNGSEATPTVSVSSDGTTLKEGTDYLVSFKNNAFIGTATATIRGVGNYTGTVTKTFRIIPGPVSLKSVASGKKKFTAKWAKLDSSSKGNVTGYQISYSTNKNFISGVKTKTVVKNSASSITVANLKNKKTYYVKLRCFKTVETSGEDTRYYSTWSEPMKVKTK